MKIIGSITCFVAGVLLNGVAISFAWGWFIAPLGVIQIGYAHAIGIGSLISYLTYPTDVKTEHREAVEILATMIARPMLYIAMAWIIQFFV